MTDLDPYFAKSSVLKPSDLDPVNDVWRFDGKKQGAGPRYGMAKDYSQDSMFWYRTDLFEAAKLDVPRETEPISYDEWLDLGKRLVKRRLGKVKVYGLNATGMGVYPQLMGMTASAGGNLFAEDLPGGLLLPGGAEGAAVVPGLRQAESGPSLIQPNPDGWDGPTYQANRMAMGCNGYWFGGLIGADPKLARGLPLRARPALGGHRVSSCFGATGFWIPKDARNKDAAWKFFEWYFGGKPAQERAAEWLGHPLTLKSLRRRCRRPEAFQKQVFAGAGAGAAALLGPHLHPVRPAGRPGRRPQQGPAGRDEGRIVRRTTSPTTQLGL